MDDQLKIQQTGIRTSGAIFLTAVLMIGPALVLIYANIPNLFIVGAFLDVVISTVISGAIAVRLFDLRWRQTIAAPFLIGVVWSGLRVFQITFVSQVPLNSGEILGLVAALIGAPVLFGAGLFLLPLFDPRVRQTGPAPTLWKVALAALVLPLLVLLAKYLGYSGEVLGLGILLLGGWLTGGAGWHRSDPGPCQ